MLFGSISFRVWDIYSCGIIVVKVREVVADSEFSTRSFCSHLLC